MTVLYRKYRPQTFTDVVGQEHVKLTLLNEVAAGRLAHSYLFTGPRGVGKTTTARILAKAINCRARRDGDGDACGECDDCREIAEGRALDVVEIDAASHTGVDNVREQIIENARFAPSKLRYKVFVIDEVHMLSASAFNALLKTLEEPPGHVVFILATTELHKLPATVVSRCQRFDFRKIGPADLTGRLKFLCAEEGFDVDREVLEAIGRRSEGCLRDAESLLTQILSLGEKRVTLETAALVMPMLSAAAIRELAAAILEKNAAAALERCQRLVHDGADLPRVVAELTELFRALTLSSVKGEAFPELDVRLSASAGAALLQKMVRVRDDMRRADLPELPLELAILEWCHDGQEPSAVSRQPSASRDDHQAPPSAPPPPVSTESPKEAHDAAATPVMPLAVIKERWNDVLRKSQEKNHGLPYMLGAAELLSSADGEVTIGFQYALYRDRLNDRKYKSLFEEALTEVLGAPLKVRAVLVAQKVDPTSPEGLRGAGSFVEPVPTIQVSSAEKLPEGFAELVKEFGGTVIS